jgi:uncharacterized membrane protein
MANRAIEFPAESTENTCSAIRRNIEVVSKLEESFIRNRTLADRIVDGVAAFAGSLKFVFINLVVYGAWIAINLGMVAGIRPFDRYPFLLLGMAISIEAIFLSTFVLIKQNRMSKRADQRAHLDLQVNLLAEREMTLVLQMLQDISARLGVRLTGEEIGELAEETSVEALATELKERLPEE